MPMGQAQQSLLGLSAFRPGQYIPVSANRAAALQAQAAANASANYALSSRHEALSRILMAQQGATLGETLRQGHPVNRQGMTRSEWLSGIEARIGMSESSQVAIPDEEIADMEAQADEWRTIYGR